LLVLGEDGLGGAGLGGAGFEFGVDPNEDPELALVCYLLTLRMKHI
jgi:26S proteasome regulatory subunit N10